MTLQQRRRPTASWVALGRALPAGPFSALLSTGEATCGVLGPVLDSTVQERQGHTGKSPAKDHEEDEETGASDIEGEPRRAGTVQPGGEKAWGKLININT